jgi:hypothetical protein
VRWPDMPTVYTRFGDLFVWGCAVLAALVLIAGPAFAKDGRPRR